MCNNSKVPSMAAVIGLSHQQNCLDGSLDVQTKQNLKAETLSFVLYQTILIELTSNLHLKAEAIMLKEI